MSEWTWHVKGIKAMQYIANSSYFLTRSSFSIDDSFSHLAAYLYMYNEIMRSAYYNSKTDTLCFVRVVIFI